MRQPVSRSVVSDIAPTGAEACPACGTRAAGRAGCQALFDELGALAWSDPRCAAVHNLAVDTYAMQHPEEYCKSAKSYAAHLTGLCCALEFGGEPNLYWAIPRWLDGTVQLDKPAVLPARGTMTVADVHAAAGGDAYVERVRAWAGDVWKAYATQQELARAWMQAAIAGGRGRR